MKLNPVNKKYKALLLGLILLLIPHILFAQEEIRFQGKYIYSDGSELFRSPVNPAPGEDLTLRIRVRKGMADQVLLLREGEAPVRMISTGGDGFFEIFVAIVETPEENMNYYFQISQGDKSLYYSRRGLEVFKPVKGVQFRIQPGFDVPSWMEGAVLYQIFVDRFNNGDPSNDVKDNEYLYDNYPSRAREWGEFPSSDSTYDSGSDRTREFYGGDLQGIIDKLDYLQDLGIEGLYLNPVFVSPSNHKYDTQDYFHIDPHFGTIVNDGGDLIDPEKDPSYASTDFNNASEVNRNATLYIQRTTDEANLNASDALFKTLVEEAHNRGIKIILDGVFNHSGSFNRWFDREHLYESTGAYESADSPWNEYYQFHEDQWPDNESYEAWYGFKTLPKLNLENNPELEAEILEVAARWVGPEFGADGWRLDVAAELGNTPEYNHIFWAKFRDAVKEANPDAVILAEVYGDSSPWLSGDQWDTIMNYDAFLDPVSYFLTGMEKHSWNDSPALYNNTDEFITTLTDRMARMPWVSLATAMNELSNHDHSRFLTRTSRYVDTTKASRDVSTPALADQGINLGIMKEAVMLQMFMPGAPTLYYGEEAGLAGFTDPDSRRTYPWGNENQELLEFYRQVIELRKDFSSVRQGSFMSLPTERQGTYAFIRWNESDSALVVLNNREEQVNLSVPLDITGLQQGDKLSLLYRSDETGQEILNENIDIKGQMLTLTLPPRGSALLKGPGIQSGPLMPDRPEVLSFSIPEKGLPGSVTVHFDRPMNQREIQNAFRMEPERRGRYYWNGNSVTFVPSTAVAPGRYRVIIDKNIHSRAGNIPMAADVQWDMTVR